MEIYHVNKNPQENGDHEVHVSGCSHLPSKKNLQYLGVFTDCRHAMIEAKKIFSQPNGCCHCCPACHTS